MFLVGPKLKRENNASDVLAPKCTPWCTLGYPLQFSIVLVSIAIYVLIPAMTAETSRGTGNGNEVLQQLHCTTCGRVGYRVRFWYDSSTYVRPGTFTCVGLETII